MGALAVAAEDVVISVESEGVDPAMVERMIDLEGLDQGRLSDVIKNTIETHPLDLPDPGVRWFDFDGTVVNANGELAIVIPQEDVQADMADWVITTVAGTIGQLAGLAAGAICLAAFAPAAPAAGPVCGAVFGFTNAFVWNLMASVLSGKDAGTIEVLGAALCTGVVAAVGGALWGNALAPWAAEHAQPMLVRVAKVVIDAGRSLGWWFGSGVVTATVWLAAQLVNLGRIAYPLMVAAARRLGYPTPASNMRIMPLGDSITQGMGSPTRSSYRAELWEGLKPVTEVVNFVGTQESGNLPDNDHEGHIGWRIDQIAAVAECALPYYRPNVVTLHAGTNDMNQNYAVETAPQRLVQLVERILALSPGVTVLVATLVPSTKPDVGPRIQEYNRRITPLIQQLRDQGKRVRLVDMSAVTTADLYDQLHPNDTGYRKMGEAFTRAVTQAAADGLIVPVPGGQEGQNPCAGQVVPVAWQNWGQIAPGVGPGIPRDQVQFADVNGDGRDDYLAVDAEGRVQAHIGVNGGSFTSWGEIAPGVGVPGSRVRFADVNGDGRDDYLIVAENGAVAAWLNTPGDGGRPSWSLWGPEPWYSAGLIATGVGAPGSQVRFADVNGDRREDYLVLADDGSVRAWLNTPGDGGRPSWHSLGQIAAGTGSPGSHVRFADTDKDGRDDYLVVGDDGSITAWRNTPGNGGVPSWSSLGRIAAGVEGGSRDMVRLADLDGDGDADYITVAEDGGVRVWLYGGPGSWAYQGAVLAGSSGAKVRFAQIDGDARQDYLIVEDDGSVRAWLNTPGDGGKPSWQSLGVIAPGVGAPGGRVQFADVNADGRDDYLVVQDNASVSAWLNTPGNGGVPSWRSLGVIAPGVQGVTGDLVRFADYDGDGRDDYLVVSDSGAVRAWRNTPGNNGIPSWSARGVLAAGVDGATRDKVRFADIDADGRDDYLMVQDNGVVLAWVNNGGEGSGGWINQGTFASGVSGATRDKLRFADVNGDGRADYLMVSESSAVDAWLNRAEA
ncbi:FG-GAP-like repeat-containing protein [Microtetraspora glauca]|uniref:FG-GAP-like repeat-containing protein n=1 Tax=Microtetraspora glauca TaxID=1996 RepID=A0ABV3GPJ3_MICGL